MAVYAYLRVSTDAQDVENQKHGILEYANTHDLGKVIYIEDNASGKLSWTERKLGELVNETAAAGDTILFAEFSRIGRSTLQVLEVLKTAVELNIQIHIAKDKIVMDDSIQSTIYATVLGLAAEIERNFITLRTKESLAKRKQELKEKGYFMNAKGEKVTSLGRPRGKASITKLDKREKEIKDYLKKGVSKRSIARIVECAPNTLYAWLKRKGY
jgi:DNA invertase Pin-like site-specific DNA recombinase